jgi:hypothetical protein
MADKVKYRWSLSNLFKSNVISSTKPGEDINRFLNRQGDIKQTELIDSTTLVNLNKIISDLRNPLAMHGDKYAEYENMKNEVIIQAALRSYADDATIFDNIKNTPVWIDTEDPNLGRELSNFLDSSEIDYKLWGWACQIAQFGDLFLENIYNRHGYLVGIRPVSKPQNIVHLIDHEDDSEGFLVRREDTRGGVQNMAASEFDAYAMNKYTHFYLDDTPTSTTVAINAITEEGKLSPIRLNVLRGRSILEPVRVNYRILRLLEDTIITNKIARSEYVRVFNVEVGEATGEGASRTINKLKRLFDAKPRFDGNTGEYQSQRVYRPAADALFNSTSRGVGAIDIKEIGGNVETQFMVDVEYFRSKMFAGLQIPKSFLGFEESLPTNPGAETLAKLDIRYTRAVRRVQLALIRGLEDLLDAYLVSRNRPYDSKKYRIRMTNPSSAEELSRLDEMLKRVEVIDSIVDSVSKYSNESVNLIQLYSELADEYMDSPRIKEVFDDLLSKSIAISYLNINSQLNEARVASISSGRNLYTTIIDLKTKGLMSDEPIDDKSESGFDNDDDSFGGSSFGSTSFGGSVDFDAFEDSPSSAVTTDDELELGEPELLDEDSDYEPGQGELPLGSLSILSENPVESQGFKPMLDVKYYASNSNKIKMFSDLENISLRGPKDLRAVAEFVSNRLVVEGFKEETINEALDVFKAVNEYYSEVNLDDASYTSITETLLSKDTEKRKKFFETLLKEED